MDNFLFERRQIHERKQNHRAGKRRRVEFHQMFNGDDRRVLGAMRSRDNGQHLPRLRAMKHRDGNASARIHPRGHLDESYRLLSARRRGRAYTKLRRLRFRRQRRECHRRRYRHYAPPHHKSSFFERSTQSLKRGLYACAGVSLVVARTAHGLKRVR